MGFPRPPGVVTHPTTSEESYNNAVKGELTEDESLHILSTTLNYKHRSDPTVIAFINSFIRCKSISQASAECGIKPSVGYNIRHSKDVVEAIQRLIQKSAMKYGFDASEIMERAKEIVDFDPIQLQNSDGSFKSNLHDIPAEARRNLKKMKVKNIYSDTEDMNGMKTKLIIGELIEYEFYDKLRAIDLVGTEKEMFKSTTKVEHSVSKDMADILLASVKRGEKASIEFKKPTVINAHYAVKEEDESDNT